MAVENRPESSELDKAFSLGLALTALALSIWALCQPTAHDELSSLALSTTVMALASGSAAPASWRGSYVVLLILVAVGILWAFLGLTRGTPSTPVLVACEMIVAGESFYILGKLRKVAL